jgi:glycosyltransferase involved in cell wall biosynthesis
MEPHASKRRRFKKVQDGMKIGIEAQRIFRKTKHGMDIVAVELVRHLQDLETNHEFVVFVKADEDDGVIHESSNVSIVRINGGPYPYWEQVLLPSVAKQHGIDLLHCTSNTAPLRLSVPLVLTLHDIIYLEQWNFTKGSAYQIAGNLYRRWNVPSAVKRASSLITVSDFEREKIKAHFHLEDHAITTIHNGVGEHFKKVTDRRTLDDAKKKYGLPERFVFFLGNTDPKKNVEGVLRGLSILQQREQLDFRLVMIDIDRSFLSSMLGRIGAPELESHISFTGYIPNHELPSIYSLATVFLYPSLRESFGMPILEAMACGAPVVTANTSSMPEVAGNAALFVDPFDSANIAAVLKDLVDDVAKRNELSEHGPIQSRKFSWTQNAKETLRLYENVLGSDGHRGR